MISKVIISGAYQWASKQNASSPYQPLNIVQLSLLIRRSNEYAAYGLLWMSVSKSSTVQYMAVHNELKLYARYIGCSK